MKSLVSTILFLVSNFCYGQSNEKIIYYFDSLLNLNRTEKVIKNKILSESAKIHSDYMIRTDSISHIEIGIKDCFSPIERVKKVCNCTPGIVSEAISMAPITPKKFINKKYKNAEC